MLLEEFLKPLKLSQAEAARRLHIPLNRLNELIKGKRGVTPDTALRLADLFQVLAGNLDESAGELGSLARDPGAPGQRRRRS